MRYGDFAPSGTSVQLESRPKEGVMTNILVRVTTVAIVTIATATFAQETSPCQVAKVTYASFDEHFAQQMIVQPGPAARSVLLMGEKQFTTQRTRWMVVASPNYTKAGPWATVVWIGDRSGSSLFRLAFFDHASGGVKIHWLNEKLLYGSVWWGRIVSTDFIFDVERKAFIYREMADYGELVHPCVRD
jgi:hypothetical protein